VPYNLLSYAKPNKQADNKCYIRLRVHLLSNIMRLSSDNFSSVTQFDLVIVYPADKHFFFLVSSMALFFLNGKLLFAICI